MGDSSEYRIFETDEFISKLQKLPSRSERAIRAKLTTYVYPQLRVQPFDGTNIRKLRGFSADAWRYRIGDFRLFYTVDEAAQVVSIVTIDDRRDAYR